MLKLEAQEMEEKPECKAERSTINSAAVSDCGVLHAGGDKDGAGRVVLRDALDKGSPPPTSGDPSTGRNHVDGVLGHVSGAIDDKDGDGFETLATSTSNISSGDPSRGRNTISMGASVSVSSHFSGHGVDGHRDDSKDVTLGRISTTVANHDSSPSHQGQ